jgi:mono/diheme cytochrome c family protein
MSPNLFPTGARRTLGAIAALVLAACGATQLGATDANLATARSGATAGASLFDSRCAGCHGARGEGTGRAPAVIGVGALPVYPSDQNRASNSAFNDPQALEEESRARPAGAPSREPFRSAADLGRFIAEKMPLPKDQAGTLSDDEVWSVVTFLLLAHGVEVPPDGVTASNAAEIPIKPR